MLYAWNPDTHTLEISRDLVRARWLHAVAPTDDERARLQRDLGLPESFLAHALDPDELPRIDHDAGGARPIQHYCVPDSGTARGTVRVDQTGRMRSDPRRPLATLLTVGAIGCPILNTR